MAEPRVVTLERSPSLAVLFAGAALSSLRPVSRAGRAGRAGVASPNSRGAALEERAESLRPYATGAGGAKSGGTLVDLVSQARVGDELVWEAVSTYLARGVCVAGQPDASLPLPVNLPQDARANAVWHVPADLGRRYASVSGDVNPIHLSALAARALGFRRALAHGMWTKAHALAAIEPRLPAAYAVEVEFGKPLFLPSVVNLVVAQESTSWDIEARPRKRTGNHLRGIVRPL